MVRQARPGMLLARSVHHPANADHVLLTAGQEMTASMIARLHEMGVYDLWVHYPGLEFLDELFSPNLSAHQQRMCETLKHGFAAQARRTSDVLPIREYRAIVQELAETIVRTTPVFFVSNAGAMDDPLLTHSAEVCYLAVMMGLKLESYLQEQRKRLSNRRAKDIVNLGIGCMLHDIGELHLPEKFRESRRAAGDTGREWTRHVELGYKAVLHQAEPSAANIVLNHHQHFDGTGFPAIGAGLTRNALSGTGIHVFSRIAMAADTFHHFLRRDGQLMPAIFALWNIQQQPVRAWFDPVVLDALLAVTPPFAPGMVVRLSDRRDAVVIAYRPSAPCYPVVQPLRAFSGNFESAGLEGERIDLAKTDELRVEAVDGFEVTNFFYGGKRVPERAVAKVA